MQKYPIGARGVAKVPVLIYNAENQHVQKFNQGDVMESAIQVRKRGVMTIPSELREKYSIKEGDTFQLVDMDGIFVLTPMVPMVPELAREIERFRKESEVSMEELMQGLREERESYYQGKYGGD